MDFSGIDGLSDEELEKIYDVSSTSEDDVYIGGCNCYTGSKILWFGTHMWYVYGTCSGYGNCGDCALRLTTDASCKSWCSRHGFTYDGFGERCYCHGSRSGSNWSACKT